MLREFNSDYLALISMAQIDPDYDMVGFDMILNLLKSPTEYAQMMQDEDLLAGLYAVDAPRIRVK
ncbi:hypothetical protein [Brevundimonas sp.]|uniref:hypothetical protein n=1 Tax=Brevundimonas sp. TaxID=1871086 RepID=UPI00289DA876|nr:hypothetical protein [Brevundimonas sp.]